MLALAAPFSPPSPPSGMVEDCSSDEDSAFEDVSLEGSTLDENYGSHLKFFKVHSLAPRVVEARNQPSVEEQIGGKMISRLGDELEENQAIIGLKSNARIRKGKVVEAGKDNIGVGLSRGAAMMAVGEDLVSRGRPG
ncbi:unnamed protein product [Dovyalis caffra]|uniref:Uncharacterized protein n=1 Tax=Dovyalis caffra TaxID=77055 RepID=A0AAV1QRN1_9ROSI|nr:unnamed protein product [Dovyalis caffra]